MSIPRSLRIACTHFGERPIPVQVSSGFCGFRNFTGIFLRCRPPVASVPSSGEDIAQLIALRSEPSLELASEVLAALLLAGGHLGLGLADELGELVDVEAGKI